MLVKHREFRAGQSALKTFRSMGLNPFSISASFSLALVFRIIPRQHCIGCIFFHQLEREFVELQIAKFFPSCFGAHGFQAGLQIGDLALIVLNLCPQIVLCFETDAHLGIHLFLEAAVIVSCVRNLIFEFFPINTGLDEDDEG